MESKALMVLLLQIATIIISSEAVNKDTYNIEQFTTAKPIIHEQIGLALIPTTIIASSTQNIYQSVYLKLDAPPSPEKTCNLKCLPNPNIIAAISSPGRNEGCWVDKLHFPTSALIEKLPQQTKQSCLTKCLQNQKCGVFSLDQTKGDCFLRTGNYWGESAVDSKLTTASALLSCILENENSTRETLCQNDNPLFDILKESAMQQQNNLWLNYKQRFIDIKTAYSLNVTNTTQANLRPRRNIDGFLESIPLIGHFYKILKSPWENEKIKEHLRQLEGTFYGFAKRVTKHLQSTRNYQGKILEILRREHIKMYKAVNDLNCDISSLASIIMYQNILQEHQSKMSEMLFAITHGKLNSDIAQVLNLEDIKLIVQNNEQFKDTIYINSPELLYRLGELILIDVALENTEYVFNFVVAVPKLAPKSLHQAYDKVQVPISMDKETVDTCLMMKLPDTIFKANGVYYQADTSDCIQKNDIIICLQDFEDVFSPSITQIGCLNGKLNHCETEQVPCKNTMRFTKAGPLIFSRTEITGMNRNETYKLTLLSKNRKQTYFFTWHDFSMVQTDRKIMYALDHAVKPLVIKKWQNPQNMKKLQSYLANRTVYHTDQNLAKLKATLDETEALILEDLTPNFLGLGSSSTKKKFIETSTYISLTVTILSILGLGLIYCCKRLKKQNDLIKTMLFSVQEEKKRKLLKKQMLLDIAPQELNITSSSRVPNPPKIVEVQDIPQQMEIMQLEEPPLKRKKETLVTTMLNQSRVHIRRRRKSKRFTRTNLHRCTEDKQKQTVSSATQTYCHSQTGTDHITGSISSITESECPSTHDTETQVPPNILSTNANPKNQKTPPIGPYPSD